MGELLHSLSAVLLVVLMMAIGYAFGRLGYMKKEHKQLIVKLIVNVGVPAVCFNNILGKISKELLSDAGAIMLLPMLSMAATLAIAFALRRILRIEPSKAGGFIVMCGLSNSLFIGLPMNRSLFGEAGVPFVMAYYVINTALFGRSAARCFSARGAVGKSRRSLRRSSA